MPILQSIGGRLDLVVRQGVQSSVINAAATDNEGAAIDLSGVTPAGNILDARGHVAGTLAFDTAQLAAGIVRAWITDATSAALSAMPLGSPANYSYAINLTFSDGTVRPFLYGTLRIIIGAGQ